MIKILSYSTSRKRAHEMRTYLMTLDELKESALGELGSMADASYDEYMMRARTLANSSGVTTPMLIVGLIYNDEKRNLVGLKETPYPISSEEWDLFVSQTEEYLESSPLVYAVDGAKFTAPI